MGSTGSQKANGSWRVSLWVSVSQTQNHGPLLHLPALSLCRHDFHTAAPSSHLPRLYSWVTSPPHV